MPARDHRRKQPPVMIRFSIERRRACQWLVLPAAQLLVAPIAWSAAARIGSARLWPAHEYTRVIFEGPSPISYQLTTFSHPYRAVLDLEGVEFSADVDRLPSLVQSSDPFIAAITIARKSPDVIRVVIDLKGDARPQLFALAPVATFGHRVVLDLYPLNPVDPLMALLREKGALTADPNPPVSAPERAPDPKSAARRSDRRKILIVLDPGHGGEDPGATGQRGTFEKDVVLAIARKLKVMLDAEPGMHATLTRDDDYYVPLATRVKKAQAVQADLFVSIHADAFRERTARGSSVFALSERGATSAAAKWLAQKENAADLIGGVNVDARDPVLARTLIDLSQTAQISDSLKVGRHVLDGMGSINALHKPVVEQAGFAVLKAPDIPSILVETAFISNPDEELKLRSDRHQTQFALSMRDGIRRYFASNPPLARARTGNA